MNPENQSWVVRLLFVSLVIVMGIVGVVSATRFRERRMLRGVLGQGILMMTVVGAARFPEQIELKLGGLVVIVFLITEAAWEFLISDESRLEEKEQLPS